MMTLFKKDNSTKDVKKNATEDTEPVKDESTDEKQEVTLDDILFLLYGIAEKVGALPDEKEEDDDVDDVADEEEDEEDEIIKNDLLADKSKSNRTASAQDEYEKNTNGGSSIDRFLLSKGLTLEEIKKVENYYSEPEVKQNEADKGQPSNTDDKELEGKLDDGEVSKNDPNRIKLNSVTAKQEEKIIKKNSSGVPEVETVYERIARGNKLYSLDEK